MKKGTPLILTGLLLIAAALCLITYNISDSNRAGKESEEILLQLEPEIDENPIPMPDELEQITNPNEIDYPLYYLNPNMDMPVSTIKGYDYIGVIYLPTLGVELPVMNEWSYNNLRVAPCRYSGTAYLENMVICAHSYKSHFGNIKNLNYGDEIIFTDMSGNVFAYSVVEIEILRPTDTEEMIKGEYDLTLFTCTSDSSSRVTVRCNHLEDR